MNKDKTRNKYMKEIQIYYDRYKGKKVCFNSRRGAGMTIEGVVMGVEKGLGVLIVTDRDGFPHMIDMKTSTKIEK